MFLGVELTFFAANLTKVVSGGWLPLVLAAGVFTVMMTWQRGREIVTANRLAKEGLLQDLVTELHAANLPRVPGTAVFPHPSKATAPFALRANVLHNHVLHDNVVIISARSENVPHIPQTERLILDDLGFSDDGIVHLVARFGFQDSPNLPEALRFACTKDAGLGLKVDLDDVSYFLSRITIRRTDAPGMNRWRKRLFCTLARNAANPAEYFGLPDDQTVMMGAQVDV